MKLLEKRHVKIYVKLNVLLIMQMSGEDKKHRLLSVVNA